MSASPARLVIALSVAAALAIFVVYTAIAGAGVAQLTPSTVRTAKGHVSLVGAVVGPVGHTSTGLRFSVKDIGDRNPTRVLVVYSGTVPDLFKTGRHIVVDGTMRHGVFAATPGSLTTKCPSKYQGSSSKA
ncbi:MAG TPA: cytochrome c maturation protein CcmE [Gaiellaceae bacterium]|nr:cytochrome c maturation protein CcmE [Gaiellaceae bacterium]